jgi:RNA polymerase-binding transcription factor DksA
MKVYTESEWRRLSSLLGEQERLAALLGGLRAAATTREDYEPHDVTDDIAAIQADAIEMRLSAVSAAIERFGSGEYGLCRACGSPIGEERLDALPATEVCLDCS